jgi:electron transport complex protein RnfC
VGVEDDVNRVFLGGPMMGGAASSLDIPITKGTSGVTAFTDSAAERTHSPVYPCIRCSYCVDACPIFLNPAMLGRLAATEQFSVMAEEHNLMDCFECGSCSFVCPSHIPLVQQFRAAKASVRKAGAS